MKEHGGFDGNGLVGLVVGLDLPRSEIRFSVGLCKGNNGAHPCAPFFLGQKWANKNSKNSK